MQGRMQDGKLLVSSLLEYEAAVIAISHPRWQERSLLIVRLHAGRSVTRDEMLEYMAPRLAKWWLPDDVVFVENLPRTATGKVQKTKLRELFAQRATS